MKKRLWSILAAVAVLTAFTGCRKDKNINNKLPEDNAEQIEIIADTIECLDSSYGIYDITGKVCEEDYDIYYVRFLDKERVIVFSSKYDDETYNSIINCCLYNYSKDEVEGKCRLDQFADVVFADKEYIYVSFDNAKTINIYDYSLNRKNVISRENDGTLETYVYSENEGILYIMSEMGGNLEAVKLPEGTATPVNISAKCNDAVILGIVENSNQLIARYKDENDELVSGLIDTNTGELTNNNGFLDGTIIENIYFPPEDNAGEFVWRNINKPRTENKLYVDYNGGIISGKYVDDSEKYAITIESFIDNGENNNNVILNIYDIATGKKAVSLDSEYIRTKLKWTDAYTESFSYEKNGIIPINVICGEKRHLVIMDAGKIEPADENDFVYYEEPDYEKLVCAKAEELEKKYSVSIKYGTDAVREYPDFSATVAENMEDVYSTLLEIDKVFGRCPEGFFSHYVSDYTKGLTVYLTGTLIQGNEEGISNPAAFSLVYDNEHMIVLDVNYIWEMNTTIAHELSHTIDNVISDYTIFHEEFGGYYSDWYDLNPSDYDYMYSYLVDGEDISSINRPLYTPADERYENDVNIAYFVRGYGNSFPTEDRATIFEQLLGLSETDSLPDFYESENIRKKAEFMFKTIRTVFEIPDNEEVYWERWWK